MYSAHHFWLAHLLKAAEVSVTHPVDIYQAGAWERMQDVTFLTISNSLSYIRSTVDVSCVTICAVSMTTTCCCPLSSISLSFPSLPHFQRSMLCWYSKVKVGHVPIDKEIAAEIWTGAKAWMGKIKNEVKPLEEENRTLHLGCSCLRLPPFERITALNLLHAVKLWKFRERIIQHQSLNLPVRSHAFHSFSAHGQPSTS